MKYSLEKFPFLLQEEGFFAGKKLNMHMFMRLTFM